MRGASIISAVLTAFALFAAPAWGQSVPPEPAAALARALDAHTTALARDRYALAAGPLVGAADVRTAGRTLVRLWAGQDYVFAAACEQACGAFSLRVIAPDGAVLAQDAGAAPLVRVRPLVTGRHVIEAAPSRCGAPSCWFAVNVYAR